MHARSVSDSIMVKKSCTDGPFHTSLHNVPTLPPRVVKAAADHTRIVDNLVGGVTIDKNGKPRVGSDAEIVFVGCPPVDVGTFEVYAELTRQTRSNSGAGGNARGNGPKPTRTAVVIMGIGKHYAGPTTGTRAISGSALSNSAKHTRGSTLQRSNNRSIPSESVDSRKTREKLILPKLGLGL